MSNANPLSDLRQHTNEAAENWNEEETLVADARGDLSPSQMVEQKLINMMKTSPLLVSQVQRRMRPGPR